MVLARRDPLRAARLRTRRGRVRARLPGLPHRPQGARQPPQTGHGLGGAGADRRRLRHLCETARRTRGRAGAVARQAGRRKRPRRLPPDAAATWRARPRFRTTNSPASWRRSNPSRQPPKSPWRFPAAPTACASRYSPGAGRGRAAAAPSASSWTTVCGPDRRTRRRPPAAAPRRSAWRRRSFAGGERSRAAASRRRRGRRAARYWRALAARLERSTCCWATTRATGRKP